MLRALELFIFIAVGVLAVELGINYSHRNRTTETPRPEETVTPQPTAPTTPATNEEAAPETPAAPAAPEQPAQPEPAAATYTAKCYMGDTVYTVTPMAEDDFSYEEGGWKFINLGKDKKVAWFNGPCLIQQD